MVRYRITMSECVGGDYPREQTWVILPDESSAVTQARELFQRGKHRRVRVYREAAGAARELVMEHMPTPTASASSEA